MTAAARKAEMRRVYRAWKKAEAELHPYDPRRKGLATLAQVFGVSINVARHAIAYGR